jgi:transcriptional regulator with XRE-family HTH domain
MLPSKPHFLNCLGIKVAQLRKERNMSQFDLACIVNKDRQSIQRLEKGNINPSIYYLAEIAVGLNIQLSELLEIEI